MDGHSSSFNVDAASLPNEELGVISWNLTPSGRWEGGKFKASRHSLPVVQAEKRYIPQHTRKLVKPWEGSMNLTPSGRWEGGKFKASRHLHTAVEVDGRYMPQHTHRSVKAWEGSRNLKV